MKPLDRTLPGFGRLPGTLPWLVAVTTFVMLLAMAAALALGGMAEGIEAAARDRLIVQVVDADLQRRDVQAERATALLGTLPGVVEVHRLSEGEISRLVTPYIGDMRIADIPLPLLIEAELSEGADRKAIAARLRRLRSVEVAAEEGLRPLSRLIEALRRLATATAVLGGGATAFATALAARSALAAHAETIAILHALGGTDGQVARLIGRRMLRETGLGAALGLGAAVAALSMIGGDLSELNSGIATSGLLNWGDFLLLGALAGLSALFATLISHLGLLLVLRRAP